MAMSVTAFIAKGPLSPSLTCGDRGPYSKIGPLLVLRVWANSHWSLFGKVDPVGVIALPGLDPGMTGQSSIPSRRLLDRPVNPRIKSEEGDDSAVAGNLIEKRGPLRTTREPNHYDGSRSDCGNRARLHPGHCRSRSRCAAIPQDHHPFPAGAERLPAHRP